MNKAEIHLGITSSKELVCIQKGFCIKMDREKVLVWEKPKNPSILIYRTISFQVSRYVQSVMIENAAAWNLYIVCIEIWEREVRNMSTFLGYYIISLLFPQNSLQGIWIFLSYKHRNLEIIWFDLLRYVTLLR